MTEPTVWTRQARAFLRAEMARRDVTYGELARRLREHGFDETAKNVSNKIGRGKFSAGFLLAAIVALGVRRPDLTPVIEAVEEADDQTALVEKSTRTHSRG